MADEINTAGYPGDASGAIHPELLQNVVAQPDEGSRDFAVKQAGLVQDYITGRAIAEQSAQAGAQHVLDYQTVKDNMVKMVGSDPHAADLAMQLSSNSVEAMGGDPALADHMHGEIAKAAITAAAGHSQEFGNALLDKYADRLSPEERDTLGSYNNAMEGWRQADTSAEHQEIARGLARQSTSAALSAFSALSDPETGEMRFPRDWGVKVMGAGQINPQTRGALYTAFANLQRNGDPVASDPETLVDLIHRAALPHNDPDHPHVDEVLRLVGAKAPDPAESHQYRAYQGMVSGDPVIDENGNLKAAQGKLSRGGDKEMVWAPTPVVGGGTPPDASGDPVIASQRVHTDQGIRPGDPNNTYRDPPYGGGSPHEQHVGLTRADAQFLGSKIGPQTPQVNDELVRLSDTLADARAQIGNDRAFGRFANWFMPAYQRMTSMGAGTLDLLDPESKNTLLTPGRMLQFMPTNDDLVAPAQQAVASEVRQSLADIFGGKRGFAMRSSDGDYMRRKDYMRDPNQSQHQELRAFRDTVEDIKGLPSAVKNGLSDVFGNKMRRTPEEEDRDAYANPPTQGSPAAAIPRETMVTPRPDLQMRTREGRAYNPDTDA